jgi:hypothetical protein
MGVSWKSTNTIHVHFGVKSGPPIFLRGDQYGNDEDKLMLP